MALKAVERTSARVLLTVGRRFDASTLGPVPANVHVEPWIDQARVLDHADLVVCHGGSGTTLAALAAGVPLVMVPLFADQFENARRVAATRAGQVVEPRSYRPLARRPRSPRASRTCSGMSPTVTEHEPSPPRWRPRHRRGGPDPPAEPASLMQPTTPEPPVYGHAWAAWA